MIITFITPAVIMFCIIFLYPILRTILMSFFNIEGVTDKISSWTFVGIDNYIKLFSTKLFLISAWNLFRIWLFGGIAVMALALLFAAIITSGIRGKAFFRAVIYMPNVVSAVALATMWLQYIYSPKFGLIKNFFSSVGLEKLSKILWLDADHKFTALLIAYCFGMVGYHMLIFTSGIERISKDYYEAATLDGADKIRQFRFMWSVTSIGFFVWSQLFSTVTADTGTITPMVYMYLQIFGAGNAVTERNAGLGAGVGVVLSLAVVLVFWISNLLLKDDNIEF